MDELKFFGVICDGKRQFSTLGIPGRGGLSHAPDDWPDQLYPGSLNIQLRAGGYPDAFGERGLASSVESLDSELFQPSFEIPRDQLANNLLLPRQGVPRGGDAQVWRAVLHRVTDPCAAVVCWLFRRFGSSVGEQLELVSGERLKDRGFPNCTEVTVHVLGRWRDA